jgi:hypothetical protein
MRIGAGSATILAGYPIVWFIGGTAGLLGCRAPLDNGNH